MYIELVSDTGSAFNLPNLIWLYVCTLAQACGWEPQGPTSVDSQSFGTEFTAYLEDDGRKVSAEDSWALADALQKLLDLPISDEIVETVREGIVSAFRKLDPPYTYPIPPFRFSEKGIEDTVELIKFLRLGAFSVGRKQV
ncbi:MAG: hypothetical protein HY291_18095 [Planctomycetes bacterium]|nr:hypothetical protein [Planctomycetota bacterium]